MGIPKGYLSNPKSGTIGGMIDALNIFAKHSDNGALMAPLKWSATDDMLTGAKYPEADSEDGHTLITLGWCWSNEYDCWGYFT